MKKIFIVLFLTALAGCTLADVNVEMLSERTALENQVLGSYNALDSQMLLVASVRGVDTSGNITPPPRHSRDYKNAIKAMQVLDFHADDLELFKRLGWVGENNQGLVEAFPMDVSDIPENLKDTAARYSKDEFNFIISKINESRKQIMQRVIDMNENLTESDFVKISHIFGKLNAENAQPGDKIQSMDGTWQIKKK